MVKRINNRFKELNKKELQNKINGGAKIYTGLYMTNKILSKVAGYDCYEKK